MTHTDQIQVTDGMLIEWDVPIDMDDGVQLPADIFRPVGPGPYPVLLSHGPYAKGASFQTGYAATWNRLASGYPEVTRNTTNKYQNFEVADPERWVPYGYACVRVDSRGDPSAEADRSCVSSQIAKSGH
jgi:predicted acyl esterase